MIRALQYGGLSGSVTRLHNPIGVVYRASSDEIATVQSDSGPNNTNFGVVLFYDRAASGNTAPSRTIEGAQTLLGTSAYAIVYDKAHDEIVVLAQDATQFPAVVRINTYAASASGDAAPLRSICGASTLLGGIVAAIAYDPVTETIYASESGDNGGTPQVLAFPRVADGDVAPSRVLNAEAVSGFASPHGLEAIPTDDVFANGFE